MKSQYTFTDEERQAIKEITSQWRRNLISFETYHNRMAFYYDKNKHL